MAIPRMPVETNPGAADFRVDLAAQFGGELCEQQAVHLQVYLRVVKHDSDIPVSFAKVDVAPNWGKVVD